MTVSAGHSAANAEQTKAALKEGLRGFTHLFNGMPQMTSRAPGILGATILPEAFCGIIADGHHVDDMKIRLAFDARPKPGRMVLVSDAMSTVAGPDHFTLYGEEIKVDGGRLVNSKGSLAGAHISLSSSVKRLISAVGIAPDVALAAATASPRDMLQIPRQKLIGTSLENIYFI